MDPPSRGQTAHVQKWAVVALVFVVFVAVLSMPRPRRHFRSHVDWGMYAAQARWHEIIAVEYPYTPKPSYGRYLHSHVLIDHTFETWSEPDVQRFVPPCNVSFNKVVLTLNTTFVGVQYDRLAHLYLGRAEVWRTSTAEPGGRRVCTSQEGRIPVRQFVRAGRRGCFPARKSRGRPLRWQVSREVKGGLLFVGVFPRGFGKKRGRTCTSATRSCLSATRICLSAARCV